MEGDAGLTGVHGVHGIGFVLPGDFERYCTLYQKPARNNPGKSRVVWRVPLVGDVVEGSGGLQSVFFALLAPISRHLGKLSTLHQRTSRHAAVGYVVPAGSGVRCTVNLNIE